MIKKLHLFLSSVFDKLDVTNYGYRVNKLIFRVAFLLMILLLVVIVFIDGIGVVIHGSTYVYCDDVRGCLNPYDSSCRSVVSGDMYNNLVDCSPSYLSYGDGIGVKPSFLARYFSVIVIVIFVFALLLNHFFYNGGVTRG